MAISEQYGGFFTAERVAGISPARSGTEQGQDRRALRRLELEHARQVATGDGALRSPATHLVLLCARSSPPVAGDARPNPAVAWGQAEDRNLAQGIRAAFLFRVPDMPVFPRIPLAERTSTTRNGEWPFST